MNNDLISRNALKLEVFNMCNCFDGVQQLIDEAPAVDAEPVQHGRWTNKTEERHGIFDYRFDCSVCRHIFWAGGVENFNYCPICGAKMDAEVSE